MLDGGSYAKLSKMHKINRQTDGLTEWSYETSVADFAVTMTWFLHACTFRQESKEIYSCNKEILIFIVHVNLVIKLRTFL